jgi:regulator of nonsense transcripts 2
MTNKVLSDEPSPANSSTEETVESKEVRQLTVYISEKTERLKTKLALRAKNQELAESGRNHMDDSQLTKLDSSIKKVTAFIKRLKTLTESQKETLGKEMCQLNLSKYLSEVAAAFTEAKLKMNDIPCAMHLCSLMHQNYNEFSGLLFEQWQKVLSIKKDEKIGNPSKLRYVRAGQGILLNLFELIGMLVKY